MGRAADRRARRADRRGGAHVRARAVLLHQRPRHRCREQRRADVPRLLLPVRDQRQRRSRRRQPAAEAAGRLQDLFRHPVRSGLPPRARDRGAAHRRRAVSALGRPARLPDGLPQPLRHRGDPDRRALSGARALRQRREHRGDLSRHGAHDRGAEKPRPLRGRRAHHDAHGRLGGSRPAEDDDARGRRDQPEPEGALRHLYGGHRRGWTAT